MTILWASCLVSRIRRRDVRASQFMGVSMDAMTVGGEMARMGAGGVTGVGSRRDRGRGLFTPEGMGNWAGAGPGRKQMVCETGGGCDLDCEICLFRSVVAL